MFCGALLNCLRGSAYQLSLKISGMSPQQLSNSLEALVCLQDSVREVEGFLAAGGRVDDIRKSVAARLNTLLPLARTSVSQCRLSFGLVPKPTCTMVSCWIQWRDALVL